jgi:hypothetical protein
MWGVEFKETSNAFTGSTATFEVRAANKKRKIYRVLFETHDGMIIQERNTSGNWIIIKKMAENNDLEAILPQGDYMHKWTHDEFRLAMTFFNEGYKRGYQELTEELIKKEKEQHRGLADQQGLADGQKKEAAIG